MTVLAPEAVHLCSFRIDESWMGLELSAVQELLPLKQLTDVPLAARHITGLINLRGQIVAVVDLRPLLGFPVLRRYEAGMLVVMRRADSQVALVVDRIGDTIRFDPEERLPAPANLAAHVRPLVRAVYPYEYELLMQLDIDRLLQLTGPEDSEEERKP
jgi:purine-binding chemotaxis protein CheW